MKLCLDSNTPNAEKLARQLMILFEGAIVRAYLNGEQEAALCAKEIAVMLLENHE